MEISIIVPAFRQVRTICDDLIVLTNLLHSMGRTFEIILVIDGDTDNTRRAVRKNPALSHVNIAVLPHNQGKGAALKHGLSLARGSIIGFLDAGGDIDVSCLPVMVDLMEFSQADIVIGSKRHNLSQVSYPLIRRFYSTGYQLLNRILFHLNIRDTQVGLKIFRRHALQEILPHITIKRFAFDLEMLVVASALGYRNIIEAPVRITHTFQSTVNFRVVFETLLDTLALFSRAKQRRIIKPSRGISISFLPMPEQRSRIIQKAK